MSYTTQQPKAAAPTPQLARAQKRGEAQTGPDRALARMHEAAEISPVVARLQALQRMADQSNGPAPLQRAILIKGKSYNSVSGLMRTGQGFEAHQLLKGTVDYKEKLAADKLYDIVDGALVLAPEGAVAEPAEHVETTSERLEREEQEARDKQAVAAVKWGARIDDLKDKIRTRTYETTGRSFAHIKGKPEQLVTFATRDEVYTYLEGKVDQFKCTGEQKYRNTMAGTFRAEIEQKYMVKKVSRRGKDEFVPDNRKGAVILLLRNNGTVVLMHFGNV
ncbi:hypothetical protein [Roseobacter sp. OBYS 0001]|uniref:hypothetical protein n=1 Tax=Roseobacter sp. OBYS 0001 TaxID=882651 RepID=UPI001BBFACCE|nr:hypothetical protein [Roseobacter sp. OBYS 0001]GIT89028.1 hypothetical protein ROBYS_40440 [Roseobacter sp. OBYS 0001]